MIYILGISAYYHDSSAVLLEDGQIIAAVQEERFSRKKHDQSFPINSINYCLKQAGITMGQLNHIVFYEKPLTKFERLIETYLSFVPFGWKSFRLAMSSWLSQKLHIRKEIQKKLGWKEKVLFTEHHESHAASAFFPSSFKQAAIICFDGVGEWATTSWGIGNNNKIELKQQISFPHSIGLLYSAFTYYLGFKVNSGEYKVMGLAPYGEPVFYDLILERLIDLKDDGSFRLDINYFNYCQGLTMTNKNFHRLFSGPPRKPESELTQKDMNIAASIQKVVEEIVLKIANHVYNKTGMKNLCIAGGVALNCVSNGRLYKDGPFENIWIQPAAGDAGGALGAALAIWYHYLGNLRKVIRKRDYQKGSYLGPSYSQVYIKKFLEERKYPYIKLKDEDLYNNIIQRIEYGDVIGWFYGKMEFGPRALGGRSIIGDPRKADMQKKMNLKIKYRESFRPFAPAVLLEFVSKWFEFKNESPYMLMVAPIDKKKREHLTKKQKKLFGIDKLNIKKSQVPAVTHIDYSSRIQTVDGKYNKPFYKLLKRFYEKTGCPILVNTSYNVRGEPIVSSPMDAYKCFMRTEMDLLVIENFVLEKKNQPPFIENEDWKAEFKLD